MPPALIDTHCHLDSSRFDEDRAHVLQRAFDEGVRGIVIPAVGPASWEALLQQPGRDRRLQVGLGIHPQLLPELPEADDERHLLRLDELLSKRVAIAVGECGLDGPSVPGANLPRQLRVLEGHFTLARKYDLPVLLHCFKAHDALVHFFKQTELPKAGVLLHSYSGGAELVTFYQRLGCHFSFAGPVSYERARKPVEALKAISPDRLMAETDAPDQAPAPHRRTRSEPAFVKDVVAAMAAALGEPASLVAERTTRNAQRFFRDAFDLS